MASLSHLLIEELGGLCDLILGLEVMSVKGLAQSFSLGNSAGDLAVIKIRCEGDKPGFGQSGAESLDGVIQPPPGMKNQYTRSGSRRDGEKALRLRMRHVDSLDLFCDDPRRSPDD